MLSFNHAGIHSKEGKEPLLMERNSNLISFAANAQLLRVTGCDKSQMSSKMD